MRLDDLHNDGQTKPGSIGTNPLAAPEALEDVRLILSRDARTAVLDADRARRIEFHNHLSSRRRMHERVFDQIA